MTDLRRFNITQLAKETNTSRNTLYDWIRRGWLKPSQIVGSRMKFSADAFLKAEKTAKEFHEQNNKIYTKNENFLSDDFFDRLERMIHGEPEDLPKKKRRLSR